MSDDSLPVVVELSELLTPEMVAKRLRPFPGFIFFDSALRDARLGRYTFISADPVGKLPSDHSQADVFEINASRILEFSNTDRPDLPPWQGGIAGQFGYELCQSLERIAPTRYNDLPVPFLDLNVYDVVIAFDHLQRKSWIISSGYPKRDLPIRIAYAQERASYFEAILNSRQRRTEASLSHWTTNRHDAIQFDSIPTLAPQFPVEGIPELTSNFSHEGYLKAVQRVIDYIHAGDAFQVNLSQRLLFPCRNDPFLTYLRLRDRNPAPFSAYFDGGYYQIASASPERFLSIRNGQVETRPIKGTRRRLASPEANLFRGDELRASEKDRAENVMIVDLMRNDLSKICHDESIRVTELCRLETYAFVQHLVSTVTGRLRDNVTLAQAVKSCFPGGSITGAPKVRAMQIISELEPTPRGPYCGSLGYLGFNGAMDLSILIRTMTAAYGHWQFPVGGGIVADSDPNAEYEETLTKAVGLVRSLTTV